MKKVILLFLLFLFSLNTSAQSIFNTYEKGTIYLRNGNKIEGLVKITNYGGKIKFKKTSDCEKIVYDEKDVKSLKFRFGDEYIYKITIKNRYIYLLKREIKGEKLDLYSLESQSPTLHNGFGGGTYTTYFIGKSNTDFAEKLPNNEKGNKYRRVISKYVSHCNNFSELIKDKKSLKKNFEDKINSITGNIIEHYNENCK
ncbi:hypothetical protein [Tenacibaculum larymnensis]|uniref:DUF4369 domain-containing protein n=1 Tax=Tenacibaculum larymnensis TaxID=2878201 RepID=A0A9X4IQ83_9FLAO|nr:hypothetical protein [Tenacibaculum larymnensis]MDE1207565.1 hypothetical protein [Tenacibaculum larymnensis]